jgi:precorrin-2 dehydrogenase
MESNDLYPIFLKLDKTETLIVGGGNIGLEKVQFILRQSSDAKIKIVSETFHSQLVLLAIENKNIQIAERKFVIEDLIGIKLLIVATDNNFLNAEIYRQAQEQNILTNVVDNPKLCDFYTGAVMQKGAVKIAVSSNGASPTLAKRLRDVLEEVIPDEVEQTAELLLQIRARLKGNLTTKIKSLNAITTVLSYEQKHCERLKENSILHNINLN